MLRLEKATLPVTYKQNEMESGRILFELKHYEAKTTSSVHQSRIAKEAKLAVRAI